MPGAVGLQAANWLATQAPRDGTVLRAIMQNMSQHQALGGGRVEFDTRKFFWIGNSTDSRNVVNSWHATGIRAYPGRHGARARGRRARHCDRVGLLSEGDERAGRHQVQDVTGYPGGNPVNLAMERGEVGGRGQFLGVVEIDQAGLAGGEEDLCAGADRVETAPGACRRPDDHRAGQDRGGRKVLVPLGRRRISRAFVTTPGVPPERVEALRRAFDATMKDPQFLAEAAKTQNGRQPRNRRGRAEGGGRRSPIPSPPCSPAPRRSWRKILFLRVGLLRRRQAGLTRSTLPQRTISVSTKRFISSGEGLTCGSAPSLTRASVTDTSLMMSRMLAAKPDYVGLGTLAVVVTVCQDAVS